jgi:PTH1 family peptidyl-tRNA hydrolase
MVVEELARQMRVKGQEHISNAVTTRVQFKGETVIIAKPLTYMNLSGRAIKSLLNRFRLAPLDFIVVLDDMDLELGKIRIRARGGSGGHKGLQSIIDYLGDENFARLRFGIGRPLDSKVVDFVLTQFDPGEKELVESTVQHSVDAIMCWLAQGIEKTMNKYN